MAKGLKNEQDKLFVFVYGTLKRGGRLNKVLKDIGAEFVGEAKTKKGFLMFNLKWYPGVKKAKGSMKEKAYPIPGEVYQISKENLGVLDGVEGYPVLYTREEVDVVLDNGETVKAVMYFFNQEPPKDAPLIKEFNVDGKNHPLVEDQKVAKRHNAEVSEAKEPKPKKTGRVRRSRVKEEERTLFVYGFVSKENLEEAKKKGVIEKVYPARAQDVSLYHFGPDVGAVHPKTEEERKNASEAKVDGLFIVFSEQNSDLDVKNFYFKWCKTDIANRMVNLDDYRHPFELGKVEVALDDGSRRTVDAFLWQKDERVADKLPLVRRYNDNGEVCVIFSGKVPDRETLRLVAESHSYSSIFGRSFHLAFTDKATRGWMRAWKKVAERGISDIPELARLVLLFEGKVPVVPKGKKRVLFMDGNPALVDTLAVLFMARGIEPTVPVFRNGKMVGFQPHPFVDVFRRQVRAIENSEMSEIVPARDIVKAYKIKLSNVFRTFRDIHLGIQKKFHMPEIMRDVLLEHFNREEVEKYFPSDEEESEVLRQYYALEL